MRNSICGLDCSRCEWSASCNGCGHPFGGACIVAECCRSRGLESCGHCDRACELKGQLIEEFNALGIADMPKVSDLNMLKGSCINLAYKLPGGTRVKFWDDERIYFGNLLPKANSERFYGLSADEKYLLVCETGTDGSDAEIVVYQRRKL